MMIYTKTSLNSQLLCSSPLHKVQNHLFPYNLLLLWSHIILPFGFDYALSQILELEMTRAKKDEFSILSHTWSPVPLGVGPQMSMTLSIFFFPAAAPGSCGSNNISYSVIDELILSNSHRGKQFFDDVKLALDEWIIVVLVLGQWRLKVLVNQIGDALIRNEFNIDQLFQFGRHLNLLDETGHNHTWSEHYADKHDKDSSGFKSNIPKVVLPLPIWQEKMH